MPIKNAKTIQKKSKTHEVTPLDHDQFEVKSGSSNNRYIVRLDRSVQGGQCNCKWGQYRRRADFYRSGCSHVQAVYTFLEGIDNRQVSAWTNKEDASRQHRPTVNIGDGVWLTSRKGA